MTDTIATTVAPILQTVDATVASQLANPGAFEEVALALPLLVLVIVAHGWGLSHVSRYFARNFARLDPASPRWRLNLLTGTTVALMALAHLTETLIWATPIWFLGLINTYRLAYYYTLEAYTTLGASTITLPEGWRLVGPVIAMSGLFTFSWTGSVLVYVMTQVAKWQETDGK